jgi:hypothetical protein
MRCVSHHLYPSSHDATPLDVSAHSVTWSELLPKPGVNKEGLATYHNSMPVGNGNVAANANYDAATTLSRCCSPRRPAGRRTASR